MPDVATPTGPSATWTTRNKVGLGLALVYAVVNLPTVFVPTDGDEGPPFAIGLICSVLALVAIAAAVVAWRGGSRRAARLTVASLVVITLTALPAFFVDVPAGVKVAVAVAIVVTVAIVVLVLSPQPGTPT